MSINLKNHCFGVSIAELWKEQERALRIIEGGTSNLLQVRNQMQQYIDDFELEKKVEPTYEECYHRKLEAKEQCIEISIVESTHLAQKVATLASKVFSIISRPKITDKNLRKLEILGYDIEQISLCQRALEEESDLMKMRSEQIQLRTARFQTTAKNAQKALSLAQKKDDLSKTNSWSAWFFGSQSVAVNIEELTHIKEKVPPADWMVHACQQPLGALQEFSVTDRFVGYLGVLLSKKGLKIASEISEEPIRKKTDKRVCFKDFPERELISDEIVLVVPESVVDKAAKEEELQAQVGSLLPEEISEDSVNWSVLSDLDNEDIAPRENIFSVRLQCLERMHKQIVGDIEKSLAGFNSISDLLKQVTENITWNYNPKNTVTSEFQLQYFRQQLDNSFAKYLELQTYFDSLEIAITDYDTALIESAQTLVDDDTIATLKGYRFPTWPLKENRYMMSCLKTEAERFRKLKKAVEDAMNTLKRKLDLSVLAEKSALKLTSKTENVTYYFRKEYVYFEEGLEIYKKKNQENSTSSFES